MSKVKIIAEIGSNWQPGNIESACEMVTIAAECGADIVKFQDFRVDNMNRPQWWKDKCRKWELGRELHTELTDKAQEQGVGFLCSVWDRESVARAAMDTANIVKIASSEIGNQPLLRCVNKDVNPMFFQKGWSTRKVYLSVDFRRHAQIIPALTWLPDCEVTLLHCISEYPADESYIWPFDQLWNYGRPVGWSSHMAYPAAVDAARYFVEHGAVVVEAHLRSRNTPEDAPDNGPWSLYPEELAGLVEAVRGATRRCD